MCSDWPRCGHPRFFGSNTGVRGPSFGCGKQPRRSTRRRSHLCVEPGGARRCEFHSRIYARGNGHRDAGRQLAHDLGPSYRSRRCGHCGQYRGPDLHPGIERFRQPPRQPRNRANQPNRAAIAGLGGSRHRAWRTCWPHRGLVPQCPAELPSANGLSPRESAVRPSGQLRQTQRRQTIHWRYLPSTFANPSLAPNRALGPQPRP